MIVISMTSWIKRIGYVKKVVESIMSNTVKPDRLYLNLSITEFDGVDLPSDLVEYFNSDERLVINWIEGENTKSMKKIFPILQYIEDDDIIIDADDDILFPVDLIESRLNDFEDNGGKYSISSNTADSIGFGGSMKIVSATSLFQKKMLSNWQRLLTKTVIETYNDDRTYLYLMWLNGYYNRPCTKWNVNELLEKFDMKLDYGMCKNKVHVIGKRFDYIMCKELGKDIKELFGYYNKRCVEYNEKSSW